ncbi:Predicted 3-hydroxylacyl-ACP dehydratase, HotDog domain [Dyella sp. OK004]|uniref:hotdog family protein n=1 Tax=Dyella sp. OK004 TaxID=1855292 RepID=UPI0008EDD313|nr:hotdog family protein [Dyella sp. OK004]SFS18621.1 Predicted 3-hydroxylacyl-ACP dehydratase, HotDog domain [Dyella sp. OK004]
MTLRPIAEVLPHTGDMILLDRVIELEAERIVCTRTVHAGGAFVEHDGTLPAWIGIELMAQTIAAWAGCHALAAGEPIRLGFLLGARQYQCDVDAFPAGSELRIEAVRHFNDEDGMGVFACRIDATGAHAEARLTVFSPPNAATFAASEAQEFRS